MPRQPAVRRAVQARSQATRDRLLDAAEELLREGGPEAATVPAIAERAGVAVGSVYRRFADKDAVLRSIYERFFEKAATANASALAAERWQHVALEPLTRALIQAMVDGYRLHAPLLSSLLRYVDAHPDADFRKRADRLRQEALGGMRALLFARRREIGHPDPPAAIDLLVESLAFILKGMLLQRTRGGRAVPWDLLARELQRMALGYLASRTARGSLAR